jgi:hypothetical protein
MLGDASPGQPLRGLSAMPGDFAALLELEPHGADTFVGLSPPLIGVASSAAR